MEGVHGTHKAPKLVAEDVISSMPENVITIIMNCLPIRDAVRTGILARNWRLKWTLLTELVFDYEISPYLVTLGPEGKQYYDGKIISRLLLHIKGPVTLFFLRLRDHEILHVEDVNHWVLFLSTKGIKEFTLIYNDDLYQPLKLPTHLFSCLELKHLAIHNCSIHLPHSFHGFPNLLRLNLSDTVFESANCGEFISRCPLLEILTISLIYPINKIDAIDIKKLGNLRKLYLPLDMLENMVMKTSSIFQLLGFFPKLEELLVDLLNFKFVVEDVARKHLSNALTCLRTLLLYQIDFRDVNMLSYVVEMIIGSPNLQTLYIIVMYQDKVPSSPSGVLKLDCSRMRQLQLRRVIVYYFTGSEDEMCLLKYLLAHSPYLESLSFSFDTKRFLRSEEKLMLTSKLLKLPRASPFAEIDFS